jgi:hypothetical protein
MSVNIQWHDPDIPGLAAQALNNAVEHVAPAVTARTPRLEGDLRASMVVHHASEGDLEAGVTFHSPYARRQHELETPNRTEPGTTGHYLEGPWMEEEAAMRAILANTMRGGMQ